jgi:GNAT superfamily N-acetyltransferase
VSEPKTTPTEWHRPPYRLSTRVDELDLDCVREFLAGSYWARDIPRDVVERACRGSLCFGLYHADDQVGFARVVSDFATFGYLADVFVIEPHRGRGLADWMVETALAHPQLSSLRRWMLATRDAHPLYERHGFERLADPGKFMEIARPGIYLAAAKRVTDTEESR